jgi:hypothetical protein
MVLDVASPFSFFFFLKGHIFSRMLLFFYSKCSQNRRESNTSILFWKLTIEIVKYYFCPYSWCFLVVKPWCLTFMIFNKAHFGYKGYC